jgi:oxygen-independent coproporphyrinogen-3 oxidase
MQQSRAQSYIEALRAEIAATPAREAASIFYGGGTPNEYSAQTIADLTTTLRERFGARERSQEISIEINPELVRECDFQTYAAAGINRISIGVQSFVPSEIKTLGRKHTPADVQRAVRFARDAGIRSVSLDLMFAVPAQTVASWLQSLHAAIELGVDHVSTYGLTIEAGTPYERWYAREPRAFSSQDDEAELYEAAIDTLESAGFEHYEISNFAKPGHQCRHNENYWANGEYIGLGVGAASYRDGERSVHTKSLEAYVTAAASGMPIAAERERLGPEAALGEAMMLALRTAQGVDLAAFKERYTIDVAARYREAIAGFVQQGLAHIDDRRLTLTKKGRFVANDVCEAFITIENDNA